MAEPCQTHARTFSRSSPFLMVQAGALRLCASTCRSMAPGVSYTGPGPSRQRFSTCAQVDGEAPRQTSKHKHAPQICLWHWPLTDRCSAETNVLAALSRSVTEPKLCMGAVAFLLSACFPSPERPNGLPAECMGTNGASRSTSMAMCKRACAGTRVHVVSVICFKQTGAERAARYLLQQAF